MLKRIHQKRFSKSRISEGLDQNWYFPDFAQLAANRSCPDNCCCLLFFHRHPSGWRMFPDRPLPVSSNCATAPWLPEGAVGDFVTPFVLERLFDYSCFCWTCRFILGHVPCKFWKVCLGLSTFHRSIMEEIDLLGCSPHIGYHWCVAWWACSALLLGCPVCSSDMDALMRSLGGRTVPDGAIGI